MAAHLKRGWVPHDEGTMGQSAQRVLGGELPHRDFDDYTGGLTFVHALAFRVFGIKLSSMRVVLFVFFVAWVPAVFYIASRFASASAAGAITLLAVAWSVPNYPGPMPSWYNLFFATFGTAALFRYVEEGRRRWVVLSGVCAGLSVLAKVTGAYFVAAALLFFVFREQAIATEARGDSSARARMYTLALVATLTVFLFLLFRLVWPILGMRGIVYFVLPAAGLVTLLVAREVAGIAGLDRRRLRTLLDMCAPFGLGVVVPLTVFLIVYLVAGAAHDLFQGLLAVPMRAVRFTVLAPESPLTMMEIIPFILPIILAYECGRVGRLICGSVLALYASAILIFSAKSPLVYSFGWSPAATGIPALVLIGIATLWVSRGQEKPNSIRKQHTMLIMCAAALCSIVQFPFAAPIYFCYVAPLVILLATALVTSAARRPSCVLGTLLAFYLLFAVLRVTPGYVHNIGVKYSPNTQTDPMTLPRGGGLRVEAGDARTYEQLIPLVQSHAHGKFIYAAPDCPEVYFLSGLEGPSRSYFDFAEDPAGHTERILSQVDSFDIDVVAINLSPRHSSPMDSVLKEALDRRFPQGQEIGRFEIRWRD